MLTTKMQKQEIKDWIEFQYKELLKSYICIGGFYFTFDQLNDFLSNLMLVEQKINKLNNEIHIKTNLITNPLLKLPTTRLEQAKKNLKEETDHMTIKIDTINKYNEKIKLSVNYDELSYIYKRLNYMRDEVEHFRSFLLEELDNTEEKDLSSYFSFVNDINNDIKRRLKEELN